MRQRARVEVDVEAEARVQLVAADAREVVALGVEEELVEQRRGVVDARRLARTLLLEQLDQRALLGARDLGVGLDRVADVERVLEEVEDLLVGRVAHRAQQHRDRQLALAVDADEDLALLVDLELEPRAAGRHQVRDEDLLLAVLGLHQVGARRAHELRHDDALGAVDDERAALGHPREVAHEDRLLADLAGLAVDERDGDRQRTRVGEVLLAALARARRPARRRRTRRTGRRGCPCSPRSARCRRSSRAGRRFSGSVSHANERRWMSMRLGTSRALFRRAKLRRVRRASTAAKRRLLGGSRDGQRRRRGSATSKDSTGHRCPVQRAAGAHGPRPGRTAYVARRSATVGGCDYRPAAAFTGNRARLVERGERQGPREPAAASDLSDRC